MHHALIHLVEMLGSGQLKRTDGSLSSLDGMDTTQAVRITLSVQRCLRHEKPQRRMREEESRQFLNDTHGKHTTEGPTNQTLMRIDVIDDPFDLPPFVGRTSDLQSRRDLRITQAGDQARVLAGAIQMRVSECGRTHADQASLPSLTLAILTGEKGHQGTSIGSTTHELGVDVGWEAPQTLGSSRSGGCHDVTRMKPSIPHHQHPVPHTAQEAQPARAF